MPIKIGERTFDDFGAAVRHVMRKFGWPKARASAYVAAIEKRTKGAKNAASGFPIRRGRERARNTAHEHGGTQTATQGAPNWREEGDWFIVPARVTGAGVMNGAHKSPEEIVRLAETFPAENPVTMLHSERDDMVPAKEEVIGVERNARLVFDDVRPLIEVDRWLDTRTVGGRAVAEANKRGEWLDNSLAYEYDLVPEGGTWFGRPYDRVEANIKALHTAVLPTGTGACSLDQGCWTLAKNDADGGDSSTEDSEREEIAKTAAQAAAKAALEGATQQAAKNAADAVEREKAVNAAVEKALKGATQEQLLAIGNECAKKAKNAQDELAKFKKAEEERNARESATLDQALRLAGKNAISAEDLKAMSLDEKRRTAKILGVNSAEETVSKLDEVYTKLLKAKNKSLTDDELKAMSVAEKERVLKVMGANTAEAMSSLPVGAVLPGKSGSPASTAKPQTFSLGELYGKPLRGPGVKEEPAKKETEA